MNNSTLCFVNPNDIIVENRAREDMGDLISLINSLKEHGFIHPLHVLEEDGKLHLIAGGRRLEASKRAGFVEIPVTINKGPLTMAQRKALELEENIKRADLTWQERSNLTLEIHKAYEELRGKKLTGPSASDGWTQAKTANLLNASPSTVSDDITLSIAMQHLDDIKECPTRADAMKLLKRHKNTIETHAAVTRAEATINQTPEGVRKKILGHSYIIGDFLKECSRSVDASVDFIEVDPPYAIDLKTMRKNIHTVDGNALTMVDYNEVSSTEYKEFLQRVISECHRILRNDRWMVFWFGSEPWFDTVLTTLRNCGFTVRGIPGIWLKPGLGQNINPKYNLSASYEMFFYARKGNAQIVNVREDSFMFSRISPSYKIHPTERPIELMENILDVFCRPGYRILVPFLGSGVTVLAAHNKLMTGYGFDLSEEYRDSFIVRIQNTTSTDGKLIFH